MTLNITVAAHSLMAQSADFLLTQKEQDGSRSVVNESAQKQVVLHYMDWSGVVCYTGLASYDSHDTATWLGNVLTHDKGHRTPDRVANLLVREGNMWLRHIPEEYRRHTFTLIAFQHGKPIVYLISSYEQLDKPPLPTPARRFMLTRTRPAVPRCVVTGQRSSVTDQQRKSLIDLVASTLPPTPTQLREAVANCSREASGRASDTVSESCVVAHLLPDGSGEAQVFGNLKKEFIPTLIIMGQNTAPHVPGVLQEAGEAGNPHRLVGATWTSNTTNGPRWAAMALAYRAISGQSGSGW
jgi:hypothetical protein